VSVHRLNVHRLLGGNTLLRNGELFNTAGGRSLTDKPYNMKCNNDARVLSGTITSPRAFLTQFHRKQIRGKKVDLRGHHNVPPGEKVKSPTTNAECSKKTQRVNRREYTSG